MVLVAAIWMIKGDYICKYIYISIYIYVSAWKLLNELVETTSQTSKQLLT